MDGILLVNPNYFTAICTSTVVTVSKDASGNINTTENESGAGGASGEQELTPFPAADELINYNPPDDIDDLYINRRADYYGSDYQLWEATFDTVHEMMSEDFTIYGRTFSFLGIMIFGIMVSVLGIVLRWAHG